MAKNKNKKTVPKHPTKNEEIHALALKRFEIGTKYNEYNHKEGKEDLRMLAGLDHWPEAIRKEREDEDRPCITVNKLPSFTDQVLGDAKLNYREIRVVPDGNGATKELARMFQGLIKGIEKESRADKVYYGGLEGGVNNGFGYFEVTTRESDDPTVWDQDIRIEKIRNPFSVVIDPTFKEADSRDKKWTFVTSMVEREHFKDEYGIEPTPFDAGGGDVTWGDENRVRVAAYWVLVPNVTTVHLLSDGETVEADKWDKVYDEMKAKEVLIHLEPNPQDPNGPPVEVEGPAPEGSGYPEATLNQVPEIVKTRKVNTHKVKQYIIDGSRVIEENDWVGKWIPIIPVWGKEINIEDKRYLRGVIRFAKDSQRMYDYFRSSAAETVALAPKAPYIAADSQIEDYEEDWNDSARKNIPVLKYKHVNGVNPPQRQVVSQTAIGEITESNISDNEMKATTQMWGPSLGEPSNEVSGIAIRNRKVESDVANYTYHDNLIMAMEFTGDILIDIIPKIYDTERQFVIMNDKEEEELVFVNKVEVDSTGEEIIINDLTIGKYKVSVKTGPSFTTQREEASASMLDFVRVAPETAKFFIDLIAENQDWPGATKIANRIRKILLPPDIDEDGPPDPPEPSIDDIIKQLKAQSMTLNNFKKKLDIIESKRDLDGTYKQVAEAGAEGAMMQLGLINNGGEGQ